MTTKKPLSFKKAIEAMRKNQARLVKMYSNVGHGGFVHFVVPGGYVEPGTAEKIKSHPLVCASHDGLFPNHDQTWRLG
jgi:hypothetical protein